MVWTATKNITSPLDVDTLISLKFLLHKEKNMRTHFTQSKKKNSAPTNPSQCLLKHSLKDWLHLELVWSTCNPFLLNKPYWFSYVFICGWVCLFYLFRSPQKTQALSSSGPPASVFPSPCQGLLFLGLSLLGRRMLSVSWFSYQPLSLCLTYTHTHTDTRTYTHRHTRTYKHTHYSCGKEWAQSGLNYSPA